MTPAQITARSNSSRLMLKDIHGPYQHSSSSMQPSVFQMWLHLSHLYLQHRHDAHMNLRRSLFTVPSLFSSFKFLHSPLYVGTGIQLASSLLTPHCLIFFYPPTSFTSLLFCSFCSHSEVRCLSFTCFSSSLVLTSCFPPLSISSLYLYLEFVSISCSPSLSLPLSLETVCIDPL